MNQWIDIHSHILPAVDDGSKNMLQTRHMLEIAHNEGITHIIATPHYGIGFRNPDMEELLGKLEQVRQEAKEINENLLIDLGNEIFFSNEIIEHLKQKKALTLAGTRYVLVEFLFSESYMNIRNGMYRLIMNGYLPILAHLERYECFYRNWDYVNDLIDMGVYLQMNISSILGCFVDKRAIFCKKLMKSSCIHFVGTDSHSDLDRAPRMKKGAAYISKKYGEELADQLLNRNALKLLQNECISD